MQTLRDFDPAKYLTDSRAAVAYLDAAASENDGPAFDAALRDVARARRAAPLDHAARDHAMHN